MARVIKKVKIFRNSVARVTSKRWLALARGMARVIKICKIYRNSVARVRSKIGSRNCSHYPHYVISLVMRWLASCVKSLGSRFYNSLLGLMPVKQYWATDTLCTVPLTLYVLHKFFLI